MIIEKSYDGSIVVSDIIDGYRVRHIFQGYSEAEAKTQFLIRYSHKYLPTNPMDYSGYVTSTGFDKK